MYRLAIFDMAGTTVDERDEVYRVLRQSVEREGARFSDEVFKRFMGTEKRWAIGNLLREGGIDPTPEVHERAWVWFREELRRTYSLNPPRPMDGVETTLRNLRAQGMKIGLTTGFSREVVDMILESMGWGDDLIDVTAAGDEVQAGRPEPYLIRKVMHELGIEDEKSVVSVGDTQADVLSARNAGVTSVGVLTGQLSRAEFEQMGADFVVDSAADLPTVLG